jgi:hypothetical protein
MDLEQINLIITNYKRLLKKFSDLDDVIAFDYYEGELEYWQKRKENFNNCLDASAGDCL